MKKYESIDRNFGDLTQQVNFLDRWTKRDSGTITWIRGITYCNGSYVAVGDGGIIVTCSHD